MSPSQESAHTHTHTAKPSKIIIRTTNMISMDNNMITTKTINAPRIDKAASNFNAGTNNNNNTKKSSPRDCLTIHKKIAATTMATMGTTTIQAHCNKHSSWDTD